MFVEFSKKKGFGLSKKKTKMWPVKTPVENSKLWGLISCKPVDLNTFRKLLHCRDLCWLKKKPFWIRFANLSIRSAKGQTNKQQKFFESVKLLFFSWWKKKAVFFSRYFSCAVRFVKKKGRLCGNFLSSKYLTYLNFRQLPQVLLTSTVK